MKALYFNKHGGPDQLHFGEVETPSPEPEEVLVKVHACALNHLDIWVLKGWPGLDLPMPHWCGADVAGEIAALGDNVTGFKVGERVVVDPGISTREDDFTGKGLDSLSPGYHILGEQVAGGNAEHVAVPARNLLPVPDGISYPEAAAPLLTGLTAWRMLIHQARLRAGESVLIVGAGGGVNSMALQIAKLAGARVYVVAGNARKAEAAESLGADVVIDRSREEWGEAVHRMTAHKGVDVVVDNVGAATIGTSIKAVSRGGRIVIVGNTSGPLADIDLRYLFSKQISLIGSTMGSHQDFREVTSLLWSGRIRPVIDVIMPLSEGKEAYERMERGEHFGKIILVP
jgi:NADPH:quinone reductase-like Zn-dependent oxidoreductase